MRAGEALLAGSPQDAAFDPGDLGARRAREVDAFLTARGLAAEALAKQAQAAFPDSACLLLTSSPVHGLANATSDIDLICVAQSAPAEPLAQQFFVGANHCEVIGFRPSVVAAALADLQAAAEAPAAARLTAAARLWKRPLRRKYLERLVNGVSLDGASPYLPTHGPRLARVWTAEAMASALRDAGAGLLAARAGETGGRAGYGLNSLLHLMDATMSAHGWVFSNRKWFLLRWRRFEAMGGLSDAARAWVSRVSHAWEAGRGALQGGPGLAADDVVALVREGDAQLGLGLADSARWRPAPALRSGRFLAGFELAFAGGAPAIWSGDTPFEPLSLTELAGLSAAEAAARLRALRANLMTVSWEPA